MLSATSLILGDLRAAIKLIESLQQRNVIPTTSGAELHHSLTSSIERVMNLQVVITAAQKKLDSALLADEGGKAND